MTDLRETLRRLARRFVARDLMTPRDELVCAEDQREAEQKLEAHPKFDVIPIRQADRLVHFLERGQSRPRTIQLQHVIGPETPILDIVDSLCDQKFVFIVERHEVAGLVHFSDLNDPIVKLPYFVLLEAVERQVADSVKNLVQEELLPQFIANSERVTLIKSKMKKLKAKHAEREWVTILYFGEILDAARYLGKLPLEVSEIKDLSAVRTRVDHAATEELVEEHSDVTRLRNVTSLCSSILLGERAA
jgi:hypothetical protein